MKSNEISILLNSIDISANSNTYWITLPIGENNKNLSINNVLFQYLKSGNFHYELVKEDIERGFNDYSELVFPKGFENPILIQKPGNVWSGIRKIKMKEITKIEVSELLNDLLTGNEKHFSKSHLGNQFSNIEATEIVDNFINALNKNGSWVSYDIETNFLNQMDDYYNTNFIQLGYFENAKRDLALGIKFEDEINILLVNGYQ